MRKVVSHLIMTLDGVVKFEAVMETIARLRDQEVQADFFYPGGRGRRHAARASHLPGMGGLLAILDP